MKKGEWKMKGKIASGIMLTQLLIGMLTLAFNIQHACATQPPVASFTYSPPAPYDTLFVELPVYFDASASYDPDGTITWYEWDFGKGYKIGTPHPSGGYTIYSNVGNYTVILTVTDNEGATDTATSTLTVRAPINPQEGEVTVNPIDDTYTDVTNPDENYESQTTLYVSNMTEEIAWLKFDLSDVPDGAVVDDARLELHALPPTETYDVRAHSCSDNSWTESTLTYSNMPSFNASQFILSSYRFSYEGWGSWGVADAVRKAVDGIHDGSNTVTIVISGIPTHHLYESSYISFHSKESLYVPELTVHWIGTDAPEDLTLDGLKAMIDELSSLGLIDNQGIVRSLIAKLNVAQRLVDKGKIVEAKSILEDDFIPQVQNLSGIHMTPEALDVLIQSAEYIISHL